MPARAPRQTRTTRPAPRPRNRRRAARDVPAENGPPPGVRCPAFAVTFVEADWPLLGGSCTTRGVQALWPKKLYSSLQAEGTLTTHAIGEIHQQLALALPVA
jgi:hypothetical protein